MNVETVKGVEDRCDAFVRRQPDAKLCHLTAWSEMLTRKLGYECHYLALRDGEEVHGILPLTHVRSRLFGNRLISHGFSNYGGPLVRDETALQNLFERAVALAEEVGCASIEFRNTRAMPYELPEREHKISMHLRLDRDPETLWKGFDAKVRNQVRKAEKSGLQALDGQREFLDDFYHLYSLRMRELGTPCYSRRVMEAILDSFPDNTRVFVVRQDGKALGAALIFWFNGLVEIPWASTLTEYNRLCPNNLLYWSILRHSCLVGADWFDFGRCTEGGGTYQFKKQWGSQPVPLHYQYWFRPGSDTTPANPDDPRYRRKIELWKKLPLWLTRWAGPIISRGLC